MLCEGIGRDEAAMTETRPSNDAPPVDAAAGSTNFRDGVLIGLMLLTLARSGEALAGDQASIAALDTGLNPLRQFSQAARPMLASTVDLTAPAAGDYRTFSATDFRPRKRAVFDSDPVSAFDDASLFRSTTVWQRLSEYKSHDRVQLLTLWESSGSTVSLQAGRRGDPSLQWTSRLMNRGGSTQGLLDRLFSVSLERAGSGLRKVTRSANTPEAAKRSGVPEVAGAK
jgi:hypothetical protein